MRKSLLVLMLAASSSLFAAHFSVGVAVGPCVWILRRAARLHRRPFIIRSGPVLATFGFQATMMLSVHATSGARDIGPGHLTQARFGWVPATWAVVTTTAIGAGGS